jgi:hypothetical protein
MSGAATTPYKTNFLPSLANTLKVENAVATHWWVEDPPRRFIASSNLTSDDLSLCLVSNNKDVH